MDRLQSITPQDIRARIKQDFPVLYGTDAAKRSVEAGHYKDIDHALLASIYTTVRNDDRYLIDRSTKPYRVSVESNEAIEEALEPTEGEDPEQVTGLVYVLGTGVFTKNGKRIVKIGYTTQDIATRIRQLYTTGAMFQFEELCTANFKPTTGRCQEAGLLSQACRLTTENNDHEYRKNTG